MKTEQHPYQAFIPPSMKVLILGSFPGKEQTQKNDLVHKWFYGAPRNQFWKIIEGVYEMKLHETNDKKQLFDSLKIGLADIILKAKRKLNSNSDQNLEIIEWNEKELSKIIWKFPDAKIIFTSRFVEKYFRKTFPDFTNIECLPSPSPRYASLSLKEKTEIYKEILPKNN